jgi:glucose/arabinose dehydrogenase
VRPAGRGPALIAALVVLGLLAVAVAVVLVSELGDGAPIGGGSPGAGSGAPTTDGASEAPTESATPAPTEAPPTTQAAGGVAVVPFVEGLERPLGLALTGGPDDGIFVAQQNGVVRYIEGGALTEEIALDLSAVTLVGGEQGMLGIALHPDFAENGRMYVSYVHVDKATILAEYTAADGVHADPASARELLRLPQESDYHKGGALVFGPEGLLYMSIGDDAWPRGTTPDYTDGFRGSVIRIDVDSRTGDLPYGIPEGNAFAAGSGPGEVFDYGLRNPWRMSIDAETGDLWIADVGSERYEEVDRHPGDTPAGMDFGWGAWEGFECRRHQIREELNCDEWADATPPVLVLEGGEFQSGDCAVIGGYVYRGAEVPALQGLYVFGDFCSGRLRTVPPGEERPEPEIVVDSDVNMSTFGMDSAGELYVADVNDGVIYRITSE